MRRISACLLICFLCILIFSFIYGQDKLISSPSTQTIVSELSKAKSSSLMRAYSFTSAPIAKALLAAHKKGMRGEVILDKSQLTEKYSSVTFLYNSGIPTRIDAAHAIAHNNWKVHAKHSELYEGRRRERGEGA
jgi:phosphatidylserine/phosphatidylglycerophosphate/cardiolipin synthase-like enzyme